MPGILYLTTWDFGDEPSTGITKKIKAQMKAFVQHGYSVDYTCILNNEAIFVKDGKDISLGKVGIFRKLAANYYFAKRLQKEQYDYLYCRYGLADFCYLQILKGFAKKECKIIVEIPSFPYDKERLPGIAWGILFFMDKICRRKLRLYVDRISTYSADRIIFGIPTINLSNGIDFSAIEVRKPLNDTDEIHLIAVAALEKWHGYDRLLRGLSEYDQEVGRKVIFHIVGEGPAKKDYEDIVRAYRLQDRVIFHGMKFGKDLDDIYDMCDIGVENLGFHRCGIFSASTLKSREYGAKGLPFITSCEVDGFRDVNFVLKFPPNEENIDVDKIVKFYDLIYNGVKKEKIIKDIRTLAEQRCSMEQVIRPVIDYYEEQK